MVRYPGCEELTEDAFALANTLPPDDGVAVLLHSLFNHLNRMQRTEVLQLRAEVAKRFGGRYCGSETCTRMLELIDAHLASGSEHAVASGSADPWRTPERRSSAGTASPIRIPASRIPPVDTVIILYSENTGLHQGVYSLAGGWRDMYGAVVNRVTYWWPLPAEDAEGSDV